jgi:Ca-activated chloride channel homolog
VKFAEPLWLAGTLLALVVAGLLIAGGLLLIRALRRFGEESRVETLVTARPGSRRAFKGVLTVLTVAVGFLAAAQPQYGRGTRLIPATNLDVIVVLDYSKSMFARDVTPSRIARAKTEVSQLVADLPGARFGAVAFAGEPLSFPLTSDGGAIAQFFRQLSPNDMPVGGTAIARALEAGRELLARDPLSRSHKKVVVLVTDGEDLEGDPVSVAQAAARDEVTINVVQIGGRTPEPLPEVDESGEVTGWRTDADGKPLTTSLSSDGEAQLAKIAESTGGHVVRSQRGGTGIRTITASLRKMMSGELSERVETVYADVYVWPLALTIFLLLFETFVSEARRRELPSRLPPPRERTRPRRRRRLKGAAAISAGLFLALAGAGGCESSVDKIFERNAPPVNEALEALDGGDAKAATALLEEYLSTGKCEKGQIGTPESVGQRPNAGFDLGLGLFEIGETFGRRFGDEELGGDAGLTPLEEQQLADRSEQVDCALEIVELVAADRNVGIDLRARAEYLAGNLEFLRKSYKKAVEHYDRALKLIPGLEDDAADGIGRDAAWNRAIALRRIEDEENKKDASQEPEPDASDAKDENQPDASDGSQPDSGDAGKDGGGQDGSEDGGRDAGDDGSGQSSDQDGGKEAGSDSGANPQDQPDAGAPPEDQPSPSMNQDERMLDMLERAPTLQQQAARNRALQRQTKSGMEDK